MTVARWIPSPNWKYWRLVGTNAYVCLVPTDNGFRWLASDRDGYGRTLKDAAKRAEAHEDRLAVSPAGYPVSAAT